MSKKQVREIEERINSLRLSFAEVAGKTIQRVSLNDTYEPSEIYLIFEDNRWLRLTSESGYDGDTYIETDSSIQIEHRWFDLTEAGILSPEDAQILEDYYEAKRQEEDKQRELAQLEELKAKYETQESTSAGSTSG